MRLEARRGHFAQGLKCLFHVLTYKQTSIKLLTGKGKRKARASAYLGVDVGIKQRVVREQVRADLMSEHVLPHVLTEVEALLARRRVHNLQQQALRDRHVHAPNVLKQRSACGDRVVIAADLQQILDGGDVHGRQRHRADGFHKLVDTCHIAGFDARVEQRLEGGQHRGDLFALHDGQLLEALAQVVSPR